MDPLRIEPTDKSMEIDLSQGLLSFSGCSIINDPKSFFDPIEAWVESYATEAIENTVVNIRLEYMDTASVKSFYEILKKLTSKNKSKSIIVNWYYEFYDPEILELGEIIQSKLDYEFVFHVYHDEDQ